MTLLKRINWGLLLVLAACLFFWLKVVPYLGTVLLGLLITIGSL